MAAIHFRDTLILAGGYNLTPGDAGANEVTLATKSEALETTVFRTEGAKTYIAGLQSVDLGASGYFDASLDTGLWSEKATGVPLTVASSSTFGATAYCFKASRLTHEIGGKVGEVLPFSLTASCADAVGLARGQLIRSPDAALTATSNGNPRQIGEVGDGQYLVVALHVLAVSGTTPSLTVTIESDDAAATPSVTTRHTFSAMTAVGSQFAKVAGPITDDWYRAKATISGTNPSFTAAVFVGIA